MKNAIASKMTESDYRSLPALNASRFKAFVRSPYHFLNQEEVEETENMKIGTAVHCAVLEPSEFENCIAYYPDVDRRTTQGKEIAKAFELGAAGKTILKAQSKEIVDRAVASLLANPEWQRITTGRTFRTELVIAGELLGIGCKARLDIIDNENSVIRDIKTLDDNSPDKFKWTVKDRMYWLQAGFYCLMAEHFYGKPFSFEFIAVETSNPSSSVFYEVPDKELAKWKGMTLSLLDDYKACKESDKFGYIPRRTLDNLFTSKE